MKQLKKIGKFFCSMKFALILLMVLVAACTVGSLIQQNQTETYYSELFSEQAVRAIYLFGLNDVFHSLWFVVLTILLCLNLILCNLIHFPGLIRRTRQEFQLKKRLAGWDGEPVVTVRDPAKLFRDMGFRKLTEETGDDGETYLYAVKNKIGIWGAWLCHLGILILIVGFSLGQMYQEEYTVYGVPGQTKQIGDTGYELTIDDFRILLREDDTVEQYQAELTMTDTVTGAAESGQATVNHPLSAFGMKLYQNSTGWAADVQIWKGEELEQEVTLCAGEYTILKSNENIAVVLSAFYPDYVKTEDGSSMSASSAMNNPAYLYRIYYHDQVVGMNVLMADEKITLDDYSIIFTNPRSYTLIQIKRDPYTKIAAIGGLIILIALILAFYLRPAELWARKNERGLYEVSGRSRKGGQLFLDDLKKKGEEQHGQIS